MSDTVSVDDLLGEGFTARGIALGSDEHGPVTATLVSHRAPQPTGRAVLYLHGFTDYFFQAHVAAAFAAAGYDFHALDLHGYGRSLRSGETPNWTTDLAGYDAEIDAAVRMIDAEQLVLLGHSTGGLIGALWADKHPGALAALVLNSPWLDLHGPWVLRTGGTALALDLLAKRDPMRVIDRGLNPVYGHSISGRHHGEWSYNEAWKPLGGFPVRVGWIRAVRRGHAAVHAGLDIDAPVLVLRSGRSVLGKPWSAEAMGADTVLDVDQIARWAPSLGRDVTVHRHDGALHDVFLSAERIRTAAIDGTTRWLAHHLTH